MRSGFIGVIALGLLTAACGSDTSQRSATGGLTGLGVGALVGGPVGAVVGAAAGGAGGAMMPEDASTLAERGLQREHAAAENVLNGPGNGGPGNGGTGNGIASAAPTTAGAGSSVPPGTPHHARGSAMLGAAQAKLRDQGYYHGAIDGIAGPETHQALRAYQQHEGLQQTARLDHATTDHLGLGNTAAAGSSASATGTNGTTSGTSYSGATANTNAANTNAVGTGAGTGSAVGAANNGTDTTNTTSGSGASTPGYNNSGLSGHDVNPPPASDQDNNNSNNTSAPPPSDTGTTNPNDTENH